MCQSDGCGIVPVSTIKCILKRERSSHTPVCEPQRQFRDRNVVQRAWVALVLNVWSYELCEVGICNREFVQKLISYVYRWVNTTRTDLLEVRGDCYFGVEGENVARDVSRNTIGALLKGEEGCGALIVVYCEKQALRFKETKLMVDILVVPHHIGTV